MNKHTELIRQISGVNPLKCMKCGKCSASCPSFDSMDIKPHQFVTYVINDDVQALANSVSARGPRPMIPIFTMLSFDIIYITLFNMQMISNTIC